MAEPSTISEETRGESNEEYVESKSRKKEKKTKKNRKSDASIFLDNNEDKSSKIVHLNVGGKHYSTTLSTLQSAQGSMLASMFSGNYSIKQDSEGRFFIDRDGKFFRYILNYLRDGEVDVSMNGHDLKQLYKEACYYQLEGLIKDIEDNLDVLKVEEDKRKKGQYAIVYMGGYGKSSQIYTSNTVGGFSEAVRELNKLADQGYNIQGVCSGVEGNYYAILKTSETTAQKLTSPLPTPSETKKL